MESLSETKWDVLIAGTGVEQSLLALALSRSDKKVLHVDKNDFYGGPQAAFSLQEVETWAKKVNEVLVSSKVYRQLEFLAVGSWWVYTADTEAQAEPSDETGEGSGAAGRLMKVPSGREDVFADESIDFKAKRLLMKFLRFVADYENQEELVWHDYRAIAFSDFLSDHFKIPKNLQEPLLALTLSLETPQNTTTEYALPRIANHLRSIGVFGPGFACVIPKWGGLAEISQVACRAQAVGGGIYVLGQGVTKVDTDSNAPTETDEEASQPRISALLTEGDTISTRWIVGSNDDLPSHVESPSAGAVSFSRSISIVSSALQALFPPLAEGAPAPAGAVVFFPTGSLTVDGDSEHPPVFANKLQGVLYGFTSLAGEHGAKLLNTAVEALLLDVNETPAPKTLWSLRYEQRASSPPNTTHNSILAFPPPSLDLKFDDTILERVKPMWEKIMGADADPEFFMKFEDRENVDDDDE
ncbi:uncharacterized protein LTHEOB_1611 [Neofusicoccum parvum]|uniref:Uncharacterized protein LTHEOB_1611 n=1 Tax=Neofusicoccum parvum TaxID=310453 RepID=A0ACB5SQU7_9PEZI|nr:uncharacterized protein LTHEOB_1611 [Neofusicoccum parvum]